MPGNMLLEVKTNIKKEKLPTSRGCKVIGKLFVNKVRSVLALSFCFDRCMQVAGEFHIGFGRDTEPVHQDGLDSMEGNHIHRFTMQQARDFNTSRTLPLNLHATEPSQTSSTTWASRCHWQRRSTMVCFVRWA